ncbi:sensor histidine kinase [Tellurirhabdus bombi]|uniref:sensor histidine kinase n=1 Tax=Tellurirhabdus bombi TaxID=2907205 RepID=UPI001F3FDB17|nr:sensor histidine kinase [Tellurirhabdus bombi]
MKLYIAVGTAVLLVMAIFIIVFVAYYQQKQIRQQLVMKDMQETYRKELMTATLQGQEQERRRIAQDLHDEIGTMLSVTKLSLNQLGRSIEKTDPASIILVQKTRSLLDETISNVRRISRDLVPTTLERFGLVAALEELAEKVISQGDIHIEIICPDTVTSLPSSLNLMLFRIAQELTNNAIKHAKAETIQIQLSCEPGQLNLSVIDDGHGFDLDEVLSDKRRGLGLRNIESRLSVVDGSVTFDVAKGRGSRVYVQVRTPQFVPEEVLEPIQA